MLTTPKLSLMQELIAGSSREELIWLSGYLAGVVAQGAVAVPAAPVAAAPLPAAAPAAPETPAASMKLTIAYGTETGNAKKLATILPQKPKRKASR